jgi:Protein of unknown function (DUF3152)
MAARRQRMRFRASFCALTVVLMVAGCSRGGSEPSAEQTSLPVIAPVGAATASPSATDLPTPTPSPTVKSAAASSGSTLSASDRRAGLRSHKVPWSAAGRLRVVPGKSAAPGRGRVYTVEVEVETGLPIDRAAFAKFVLTTLNDKRSWTEKGKRTFARVDKGGADIRVVLASPAKSASMCRPLRTFGKLSCREGNTAVLTDYRWVKAIPEYSGNHDGYRHYMVNHEVGHVLGHRHEYCAGKGKRAPVMMQQTKGLKGCRPNPWPHP